MPQRETNLLLFEIDVSGENEQESIDAANGEFMMSSIILPMVGSAIIFFLYLVLAAILIRKFNATGDVGFIWLGIAAIAWPIVANLIRGQIAMRSIKVAAAAPPPGNTLLVSFDLVQRAVEVALLIVAARFLSSQMKQKSDKGAK
jgi:hypothetical protein